MFINIAQINSEVFEEMAFASHPGWSSGDDEAPFAHHCLCERRDDCACDAGKRSLDDYYGRVDTEYTDVTDCYGCPIECFAAQHSGYGALDPRGIQMFFTDESDDSSDISDLTDYPKEEVEEAARMLVEEGLGWH